MPGTKYSTGRTPTHGTAGGRSCPVDPCPESRHTRLGMEFHLLRDHDLEARLDALKAGLDAASGGAG